MGCKETETELRDEGLNDTQNFGALFVYILKVVCILWEWIHKRGAGLVRLPEITVGLLAKLALFDIDSRVYFVLF